MAHGPSLTLKGLVVLFIPLLVELLAIGWLFSLSLQLEQEALRAEKAREISETAGRIVKRGLNCFSLADAIVQPDTTEEQLRQLQVEVKGFNEDFDLLQSLVADNADSKAKVSRCRAAYLEALRVIGQAHNSLSDSPERAAQFHAIRHSAKQAQEIFSLEREAKEAAAKSPGEQAKIRHYMNIIMLFVIISGIGVTAIVAVWFKRHIVGRLELIIDNSHRLAAQKELHNRLPGGDEISKLDGAFHDMSNTLAQATSEQAALTENARDLICSINNKGIFVNVSSASKSLLGYSPDELTGSKLLNIIVSEDANSVVQTLKTIASGKNEHPFETRLRCRDGRVIDVLWSATWSGEMMFCVLHDISEQKQAARLRQEVVQMVSHDLRSPLLSIKGIIEMGQAGLIGQLNEQGHKMFAIADRSSNRMLSLINDLLDVERLEAGMLELDKNKVLLAQVFDQSLQTVANLAADKGIKLAARPTDILVVADADRLVQILVNLISNAIKFSAADTSISLSAHLQGSMVKISVKDQGRGIPPEQLETIFDRFQQVQASDSQGRSGSGLGLAICKALVGLHGGEISAESEPGKGSTFSFTIPA